jgi:hypothetical protein
MFSSVCPAPEFCVADGIVVDGGPVAPASAKYAMKRSGTHANRTQGAPYLVFVVGLATKQRARCPIGNDAAVAGDAARMTAGTVRTALRQPPASLRGWQAIRGTRRRNGASPRPCSSGPTSGLCMPVRSGQCEKPIGVTATSAAPNPARCRRRTRSPWTTCWKQTRTICCGNSRTQSCPDAAGCHMWGRRPMQVNRCGRGCGTRLASMSRGRRRLTHRQREAELQASRKQPRDSGRSPAAGHARPAPAAGGAAPSPGRLRG